MENILSARCLFWCQSCKELVP